MRTLAPFNILISLIVAAATMFYPPKVDSQELIVGEPLKRVILIQQKTILVCRDEIVQTVDCVPRLIIVCSDDVVYARCPIWLERRRIWAPLQASVQYPLRIDTIVNVHLVPQDHFCPYWLKPAS